MTSALALIYLSVIAMLSVGFYTAVDLSSNIADNEQNINRANTSSEVGLAYGRYQLSQLAITNPPTNGLVNAVYTALNTNLAGSGNLPTTQPTVVYLPGSNGAASWMNVDSLGGQAQLAITQPLSTSYNLQLDSYGQNSNSRVTAIKRHTRIQFSAYNPIFNYGLVSYGQISLNGGLTVNGTNGGVLAITSGATKPINVSGANAFSGDFYWTNAAFTRTQITWGSLTVDGYNSASGQFANHVHGGVPAPVKPTFDTTPFQQYIATSYTNSTYSPTATTLTNAALTLAAGQVSANYSFSGHITINGILYLDSGVTVTFTNPLGVTINGAIVQQNAASPTTNSGSLTFDGPVAQSTSNIGSLPAAEQSLLTAAGDALLVPNYSVTFDNTVSTTGAVIGAGLIFNKNATISGAVLDMNSSLIFNSTATITINSQAIQPAGVNITYSPTPSSYAEVYP
jgi:Tfp pilus assembly protein PilX